MQKQCGLALVLADKIDTFVPVILLKKVVLDVGVLKGLNSSPVAVEACVGVHAKLFLHHSTTVADEWVDVAVTTQTWSSKARAQAATTGYAVAAAAKQPTYSRAAVAV